MRKTIQWSLIGLVLIAGCLFRFWDLSWHFAHIDDIGVAKNILDAKHSGLFGFWSVAQAWTYAPFQFWITSFLLNLSQSYREILFWGRLPSAVFSTAALFAFTYFYFMWKPEAKENVLLPLTLLACSWENIIFAKQMNNYALGVLTMCVLLILLMSLLQKHSWRISDGFYLGFVSGSLVWLHYQVLFILAPLLGALFISKHGRDRRNKIALAAAAAIQFVFILPLFPFLKERLYTVGLSGWNQGPHNEFLFSMQSAGSFLGKIIYVVKFFGGNFCLILRSQLAFMPERMFSPAWGVLFAVLFFIGLYAFFRKGDEKDRAIGYFSAGIFAVWTLASILPKVTVSPTRHSLIFTPLIVITVSRGIYFAIEKLKISKGKEILPLFLSAALLLTSLMSFDQFLKSRRDPFVEEEIRTVLQEHPVDVMFRVNFTSQVSLMKSVRELTGIYDENTDIYAMVPRQPASFDRIAWISHRDKLTADSFEQLRLKANLIVRYMNQQRLRQGLQPIPMMDGSLKDYQIIYRKEIASDQEIEYSRATQNGSNNLFFYILNRKISNL